MVRCLNRHMQFISHHHPLSTGFSLSIQSHYVANIRKMKKVYENQVEKKRIRFIFTSSLNPPCIPQQLNEELIRRLLCFKFIIFFFYLFGHNDNLINVCIKHSCQCVSVCVCYHGHVKERTNYVSYAFTVLNVEQRIKNNEKKKKIS